VKGAESGASSRIKTANKDSFDQIQLKKSVKPCYKNYDLSSFYPTYFYLFLLTNTIKKEYHK